jgi:hypothetical protein
VNRSSSEKSLGYGKSHSEMSGLAAHPTALVQEPRMEELIAVNKFRLGRDSSSCGCLFSIVGMANGDLRCHE